MAGRLLAGAGLAAHTGSTFTIDAEYGGQPKVLDDKDTCPGTLAIDGYGDVEVVAAKWNVPDEPATGVVVDGSSISPWLKGRAYFASSCEAGKFDNSQYVAMELLGKTLRWTTDLSEAGCGCNAAFYLTSLHQNPSESNCKDFYCDANSVCGERCAEIDLMEANKFAWRSTLHTRDDGAGVGGGYGGGALEFTGLDYGPGASCIDTLKPFRVACSFPTFSDDGTLAGMDVTLSQSGCHLPLLDIKYPEQSLLEQRLQAPNKTLFKAKDPQWRMLELTEALRAGMAPIVSFWESKDMLWLDGMGGDKETCDKETCGPCEKDLVHPCPEKIPLHDFSLEDCAPRERPGAVVVEQPAPTEAPVPTEAPTPAPPEQPPDRSDMSWPQRAAIYGLLPALAGSALGLGYCLWRSLTGSSRTQAESPLYRLYAPLGAGGQAPGRADPAAARGASAAAGRAASREPEGSPPRGRRPSADLRAPSEFRTSADARPARGRSGSAQGRAPRPLGPGA